MNEKRKPHHYRLGQAKSYPSVNPNEVVGHRNIVFDDEQSYASKVRSEVQVSADITPEALAHLQEHFPQFERAVWLFERGKAHDIKITGVSEIYYRGHVRLYYTVGTESKSVMLKKTPYARVEKLMTQLAEDTGLPSYKVFPVEGYPSGKGAHWQMVVPGPYDTSRKGFATEGEYWMPMLTSKYAVIEFLDQQNFEDMHGNIKTFSIEEQTQIVSQLAQHYCFEFVFGVEDSKSEHYFLSTNPIKVTCIDRQKSFVFFPHSKPEPMLRFAGLFLRHRLNQTEYQEALLVGAREFVQNFDQNSEDIQERVRRAVWFGVPIEEGVQHPVIGADYWDRCLERFEMLKSAYL